MGNLYFAGLPNCYLIMDNGKEFFSVNNMVNKFLSPLDTLYKKATDLTRKQNRINEYLEDNATMMNNAQAMERIHNRNQQTRDEIGLLEAPIVQAWKDFEAAKKNIVLEDDVNNTLYKMIDTHFKIVKGHQYQDEIDKVAQMAMEKNLVRHIKMSVPKVPKEYKTPKNV